MGGFFDEKKSIVFNSCLQATSFVFFFLFFSFRFSFFQFLPQSSRALTNAWSQESTTASSPNHLAAATFGSDTFASVFVAAAASLLCPLPPPSTSTSTSTAAAAILRGAWNTPSRTTFSAPGRIAAESGTTPVRSGGGSSLKKSEEGRERDELVFRLRFFFRKLRLPYRRQRPRARPLRPPASTPRPRPSPRCRGARRRPRPRPCRRRRRNGFRLRAFSNFHRFSLLCFPFLLLALRRRSPKKRRTPRATAC